MLKKLMIVGIIFTQATFLFAKAGINIYGDNNTANPVLFKIMDLKKQTVSSYTVPPYRRELLKYVTTGYISDTTMKYKVSIDYFGTTTFSLVNGWTGNFLHVKEISGNIAVDNKDYKWGNRYGTPGVTITANPIKINRLTGTIMDGISRVLIFGDSLSDKGTLWEWTQGLLPNASNFYNGMFSDGNTWSRLLALQLKSHSIKVSNYAVAGATAAPQLDAKHLPYSLGGEINAFRTNSTQKGWKNFSSFLSILWIGGNDYLSVSPLMSIQAQEQRVKRVIDSIDKQMTYLIEVYKLNKFVFINLPDLSLIPKSCFDNKNGAVTKNLTLLHNKKLKNLVDNFQSKYPNKQFELVDIDSIFDGYVENTSQMNRKYNTEISNTTGSAFMGGYMMLNNKEHEELYNNLPDTADIETALMCNGNSIRVKNPYNYIFWDRIHPTQQMHRVINQYILVELGVELSADNIKHHGQSI